MFSIVIVGGGAAGLATAIFAARRAPDASIAAPGRRTHAGREDPRQRRRSLQRDQRRGQRARLQRRPPCQPSAVCCAPCRSRETVEWFAGLGVPLHEEARGKLFPDSNRARTVLDALIGEARARGVRILAGQRVEQLGRSRDGFTLVTSGGILEARYAVLATGGLSLPSTGSDGAGLQMARALGHSIVATTPALVPLVLDGDEHAGLQGVSHEARLAVSVPGQRVRYVEGPMLWTHFGVSGPAVLDASRHVLRAELEGTPASLTLAIPAVPRLRGGRRLAARTVRVAPSGEGRERPGGRPPRVAGREGLRGGAARTTGRRSAPCRGRRGGRSPVGSAAGPCPSPAAADTRTRR